MNAEVRAIKTPAEQALTSAYQDARAALPGKGNVAVLRDEAFNRFEATGLPHRRVEEWKYTDLRALMRDALPLAAPADAAAKVKAKDAGKVFASVDCRRLVFVDGGFMPELSDLSAEPGLTIGSMAAALGKGDPLVAAHVGKVFETDDAAVALNTALMGDGAVIHIAAGTVLARTIHLVFASGETPSSSFIRSLIVVEKGAQAVIAESHESNASQVNCALELVIGDGAQVDYFKATQTRGLHVASLLLTVGAKAAFNTFALSSDASLVRNQSFVRFAGEGSTGALRGVNLLRGKDHVDTTMLIEHAAGHCASREQFKSVLDDQGHNVFQGKIVVKPHAQKTDTKMMTRALLLSDEAAGALDPGLKFYLMSRGIDDKQAEALLIQAFIGETIEEVAHEGFRDALMTAALSWLESRA